MGQALGTVFWLAGLLACVAPGLSALAELRRTADEFVAAWTDEYALRGCAYLAASRANLADAASYLGVHHADARAQLANVARTLAAEQRSLYAESAVPFTAATADDLCASSGPAHLFLSRHRQRHAGQPALWPNWVPAFHAGSPP